MSSSEPQASNTPPPATDPAQPAAGTPPPATDTAQPAASTTTPATDTAQPAASTTPATKAEQQAIPAVGFMVAAFTDESAADRALDAMKAAKKQKQFYFEDAAVIRQDAQGKVRYHETGDMTAGKGAGIGALVGGVLGILAGPPGVVLGAGAGAAIGAAITASDQGFRNESLGTIGVALKPGTSAVAAITSHNFLKAVQQQVPIEDTREFVRKIANELSRRLAENMNVAIGLILTEKGLAIKEIAANAEITDVTGAVITSTAVAVGEVVYTAKGTAYRVVAATQDGAVAEEGVITDKGAVILDVVATPAHDKPADAPTAEKPADTPTAEKPADAPAAEKPADAPTAEKPADTPPAAPAAAS